MVRSQFLIAALAVAAISTGAKAGPVDNLASSGPRDARVQVGIVIPLGGGGTDAEQAPRIEAWSEQRAQRPLPQARLRFDQDPNSSRPVRLGINFGGNTRLMIDGREMRGQDKHHNISTLGWVGIGAGVAVIVFGVFALDAFNKDNGLNGL